MSDPAKVEFRSRVRARIGDWDPALRTLDSARIRERILQLDEWQRARTVLLFAPLRDEPDVWPLLSTALETGRRVALPVFDSSSGVYTARQVGDPGRDLVAGRFGVREPGPECPGLPLASLDLVMVPGLAFTREGWRLGRGGGFYDRLLNSTPAVRCGVGRDEQLVVRLPIEPHDVQLDLVLTPSASHRCRRSSD